MINQVREKVKSFLRETLNGQDIGEEVRVIGIDRDPSDGSWNAEAEVVERDLTLPGLNVFEKKYYIVKLDNTLDVLSYRQLANREDREDRLY